MAGLEAESDSERPGNKKRKRKEKKRQWVWTIGTNEDDSPRPDSPMPGKTPVIVTQRELPNPEDQTNPDAAPFQSEDTLQEPKTISERQAEQPDLPIEMEICESEDPASTSSLPEHQTWVLPSTVFGGTTEDAGTT